MELIKQSAKERFEAANMALSKHCFEAGRLHFVIELDEESLEKKKLQYKNMRVDFDKLNKELQRATEEWQKEEARESEKKGTPLPETLN